MAESSMQNPAPAPWCGEVAWAASPDIRMRELDVEFWWWNDGTGFLARSKIAHCHRYN